MKKEKFSEIEWRKECYKAIPLAVAVGFASYVDWKLGIAVAILALSIAHLYDKEWQKRIDFD